MNKKVLSLVLALAIVLGSFGTVALASNDDVAYNSQAQKIQWLIDNEHVVGRKVNEDGSADLALEDNVTRAEITKLLVHILGRTELAEVLQGVMRPFPDVTVDHWANGFISVATTTQPHTVNENRIVIGYPDGNFYPENNVTYAELATMLVRIVKDDLTTKMEADSIWATSYMRWAKEEGILDGLTIANSDRAIPRADAFEMIYNAFFQRGLADGPVKFGDQLGIVSRLGNGEIQLNQDANKVYKIDSNTMLTDGTLWFELLQNIDRVNRGSLVRIITDSNGRVTHLLELGNPRSLALGTVARTTHQNEIPNLRWHGVAKNTAEGNAKFRVVNDRYVDITVNSQAAEINSSTRLFVADVNNNALKEVQSVTEAFNLLGIRDANPTDVYMGYDVVNGVQVARVIVFNDVDNYFGQKDTLRVTGRLNSLYRFEAEDTKGVKRAVDTSNIPMFPSNDLLAVGDVVEVTDNTNVAYAAEFIRIDASEAGVYRVDDVQFRSIKLVDKDGFARTYPLSRDLLTFLEGQLVKGAHVQVAFNDADTEIEIVSVVNRDLKGILEDGVRIGEDRGFIVDVKDNEYGRTQVVVADRRTDGQLVNHRTYEVEPTSVEFVTNADRTREIMFDVESKFGNTNVMYNVDYVRDQALAKAIKDYKDLREEVINELGLMTKDEVEALSKGIAWADINDSTVEELVAATNELKEAAAQAEVAPMVKTFKVTAEEDKWTVDLTFNEIEIKDLDSLVIALYAGDTKIGEQEATQANLELDRGEWPSSATSPFNIDQTEDENWTKNMDLLSGTPDKLVLTFELDGQTYTFKSTDVR